MNIECPHDVDRTMKTVTQTQLIRCSTGSAPVSGKSGPGDEPTAWSQRRHRQLPHAVAPGSRVASGRSVGVAHNGGTLQRVSVHSQPGKKVLAAGFQVKSYTGILQNPTMPRLASKEQAGASRL